MLVLYWTGMERVYDLVFLLIWVEMLWACLHLNWYWVLAWCKSHLMKCSCGGSFSLFIWWIIFFNQFMYVVLSLNLWHDTYLIMGDDLLDEILISVCKYFIEYFCIFVHKGSWKWFFLLGLHMVWVLGNCGLKMNWAMYLLFLILWNNLRRIDVNSSIKVWSNSSL